jgi:gluconokinase
VNGQPVTPIYTWADTRAARAAEELRRELDPEAVHATTGCVIHPSYLPAKLRWLLGEPSGTHPGASTVRRVRYWLSFAEYLTLRLFGKPTCSISMASGSGLLDQHLCTWDTTVLAAIPIGADHLSPLSDTPRTQMREPYASRWPVLTRLPWFPGWGDGAMSNVGSGCVEQGQVAMMVGTSAAMREVWETQRFTIPPRLWCYRVDARRIVVGGALSNGGNVLGRLRATLNVSSDLAALEAEIAQMAPDAHGLTILPFLAGERSTGWHAEARGTITGISLHTRPTEILRAGYEAIAYRLWLIYELLQEAVPGTGPVIASGGALLHSPTWLQMITDVLGVPVTASAVPEASSRGAALAALEALGAIASIGAMPAPLGATYQPDQARMLVYRQGAARQRALYEILVEHRH